MTSKYISQRSISVMCKKKSFITVVKELSGFFFISYQYTVFEIFEK